MNIVPPTGDTAASLGTPTRPWHDAVLSGALSDGTSAVTPAELRAHLDTPDGAASHAALLDRDAANAHPQAAITGLEPALAAKAAVGHTHAGAYDPAGAAVTAVSAHEGAHPHTQLHTHANAAALAGITAAGSSGQYLGADGGYHDVPTGGSGGTTAHNDLTGRDAADAHPQSAVTGLSTALAAKAALDHTHAALHTHTNAAALAAISSAGSAGNYLGEDGAYHTVPSGGSMMGYPAAADLVAGDHLAPLVASVTAEGVDASTRLLLHGDGTDGATVITDTTGRHAVTPVGSAQLDIAQSKFGGSSIYLPGGSSYATIPDSADFHFAGDFCIDFHVRLASVSGNFCFLSKCYDDNSTSSFFFEVNSTSLSFYVYDSGFVAAGGATTWATDVWHHIAALRLNNVIYVYRNGALVGSSRTHLAALGANSDALAIGSRYITGQGGWAARDMDGWIDELRISNGTARINDPGDRLYIASGVPADGFAAPAAAYGGTLVKEFVPASGPVRFPAVAYGGIATLTDAASIATDASSANTFSVTLSGNRTLATPTNLCPGAVYTWYFRQDATGGRTLAFSSIFRFEGGTIPTLSTGANAVDYMTGQYDGTHIHCAALVKNSTRA